MQVDYSVCISKCKYWMYLISVLSVAFFKVILKKAQNKYILFDVLLCSIAEYFYE